MKTYLRRLLSMILAIAIVMTNTFTGFAESAGSERMSASDVLSPEMEGTWAEVGRQIAGMLGFIVEDAANIDLTALSSRITDLSLTDDSVLMASSRAMLLP